MREFERCLGLPVIAMDTAEELGVTTHFVTDPWANRVLGFVVSGVNGLAERRAFRFEDVASFGEDVIVLETQASLLPISKVDAVIPYVSPTDEQPRRRAWTDDGRRLGTILDHSFDERDAGVLTFTLWPVGDGETVTLSASAVVSSATGLTLFNGEALPLDLPETAVAEVVPAPVEVEAVEAGAPEEPVVAVEEAAVASEEEETESLVPVEASLEDQEVSPEEVAAPDEDLAEGESEPAEVPVRAAEEEIAPVADDPEEEVPVEFVTGADAPAVANGNGHEHGIEIAVVEEPVALNGNGHAPAEAVTEVEPVLMNGREAEAPEAVPANGNGHEAVAANGNGHAYTNGTGNGHSYANGNGHSNGNGNGSTHHEETIQLPDAAPTVEDRIDDQVRRFMPLLVGCYVSRDIRNDMGETVVYQGQEVTPEIVLTAWKVNRLFDLYTASQTPSKAATTVH